MGDAAPAPNAEAPARPRLRVTGVVGALAAVCVVGSFFLPWIDINPERAQQFRDAVERELAGRTPPPAGGADFRRLATTMVDRGALQGTDFILWVRTAKAFSAELDERENPGVEADVHQRRLEVVRILLYGIPAGALLLAAYFLFHRFRRARFPALVLSILVGVAAVVLAGTLQFGHAFIGQTLREGAPPGSLGAGWRLLLGGGVALGLAGFFGVTTRNWFRVYVISALTAAALAFLALRYLETGGLP